MYAKVSDLPISIKTMLKVVGYNKADIKINVATTISPISYSGDGYRSIFATTIISDNVEEVNLTKGSWGGVNPFTSNIVDSLDKEFTIPNNVVCLKAREGGCSPMLADLYISPSNTSLMLSSESNLSDIERKVLACYKGLTSAGRKDAFLRMKKSELESAQSSLISKGFIVKKGNGIGITIDGKNALGDSYSHLIGM